MQQTVQPQQQQLTLSWALTPNLLRLLETLEWIVQRHPGRHHYHYRHPIVDPPARIDWRSQTNCRCRWSGFQHFALWLPSSVGA